jgi:hypothetical protein
MAQAIGMVLDRIEAQQANALQLGPDAMSIDLLRAVYRNPSIPLPVRIRCAVAALPHEVPRLQVTAQVNEHSFAELLEKRIKRIAELETNGNPPQMIEQPQIETKPVLPRTSDRRYRRL